MTERRVFSFNTVASMIVEWGAAKRLGDILGGWFTERRLLIVTDKGLHQAGVLEPAKASLAAAGFAVNIFDDVVADPPEPVLFACVAMAKAAGVNLVLGLGGGLSMDMAKLAAVLVTSEQELSQLYGIDKVRGDRLPLVQLPTTAGTGSEGTNITILTTGETTKMGVVANQLYADRVVLDAELRCGLPALHTAATGIDAIEAYTSNPKKNPLSDVFARRALKLLSSNLVAACEDGQNRAAREAMLLGANFAGQAFSNSPVGAVHALACPLGGHYHVPHGLSNALMLGPVLRFSLSGASALYAELADLLFGDVLKTKSILGEVQAKRGDENFDYNPDRAHMIFGARNAGMSIIGPDVTMGGPIWAAMQVVLTERFSKGRKAMDSIFGGAGSLRWGANTGLIIMPIVTLAQPILGVALSLTLLIQGYVSVRIGVMEALSQRNLGITGVTGAVLATRGGGLGIRDGRLAVPVDLRPKLFPWRNRRHLHERPTGRQH